MKHDDSYFAQFSDKVDDKFIEEVAEAEKANADLKFDKVPDGDYKAEVIDMLLKKSKAGNLMIQTTFKILEGQYEKNAVKSFMLMRPNSMYFNNQFLKSLGTDIEVVYKTDLQYAKLVEDIFVTIRDSKIYDLNISTSDSGYTSYKINAAYDKEQEELPFS